MTENRKPHFCTATLVNVLVLFLLAASAQTPARKQSKVELGIRPSELIDGVPERINFVFVNISDHELRIPPVSPCIPGRYSGTVKLHLAFSPLGPQTAGKGGGCGGGADHPPGILEQATSWTRLKPGASLTISYQRVELFVSEQSPGAYDFWGEYQVPQLRAEDLSALESVGIDFASETLRSTHLRFQRVGITGHTIVDK
jgi:hypothetical protein